MAKKVDAADRRAAGPEYYRNLPVPADLRVGSGTTPPDSSLGRRWSGRVVGHHVDLLFVYRRPDARSWAWMFFERQLGLMAESSVAYDTRDRAHAAAGLVLGPDRLGWMRPIRRERDEWVTVPGGVNQSPRPDVLIGVSRPG